MSIALGEIFWQTDEHNPAPLSIKLVSEEAGVYLYQLSWTAQEPVGQMKLVLRLPMRQVLSVFHPTAGWDRSIHQWFAPNLSRSSFYFGAPFCAAVTGDDENYALAALEDGVNDTEIGLCVNDFAQDEKIEFRISLLTGRKKEQTYCTRLRLDLRPVALTDAMEQLSLWWQKTMPPRSAVPRGAREPLYSSWYNYHQHPDGDSLRRELAEAAAMGFRTVILDDGWQFDGPGTGDYINSGDWAFSREKFPDPKAFVEAVHDLGMELALWFPVPFAGWNTRAYREFKDCLLYDSDSLRTGILDVRYQKVRRHIVKVLTDFVREYGLDGLKLDFIDSFQLTESSPPACDAMDQPELSRAVICLLQELEAELARVRPGALLEYRQNYVGPAITRFGNMLRVGDCAFESQTNRRGIGDLRLLHHPLAVHADMLYWAENETVENCARQLVNILFGVPQISVLLTRCTQEQKALLTAYLQYWTAHRDTLLDGHFVTHRQDMGYTALEAWDQKLRILALYGDRLASVDQRPTHVFNGTPQDKLVLELTVPHQARIFNPLGELTESRLLAAGLHGLCVPVGGHVELDG